MMKIFLLLIALLSLSTHARAAADPAIEAMETLRRGFAGITDFTADITQEKQLSLMKQKMVSKGVVRFKKPDVFYMELFPPHASRLLLKDNQLTMKFPEGGTNKVVLQPEEGLRKWFAYLGKPVTMLPEGVDVKAERQGKQWNTQIFPRSKGSVRQLNLIYDTEGKISRIVIEEKNKDRTVLHFKNLRRNVGLKDSDFRID